MARFAGFAASQLQTLRLYAALTLLSAGLLLPGLARAEPSCPPCAASGASATGSPAALLDLNTATEAELMNLPGVGPSKAKAILAFREAKGRFHSVSQLLRVKGFGRATVERLRPLVMVEARGSAAKSSADSAP